ncbi:DUF4232 domain-containing protein [Streptomyces sp. NPDC001270]|uniref:DUF4232 domain-containing protein n=1 Tax=Streptomyces sp. NPDC001270 TaxID=3364554 RepID=UPI00368E5C67
MRVRTAAAVPALALAAAAPLLAAPHGAVAARDAVCPERALTVRAAVAPADPSVLRIGVTNRSGRACVVDRVPTVTFGDLDGAAQPVPDGAAGTYRIGAGRTAYAAVRTVADPADPQARLVDTVSVAADPAHRGRGFSAAELGAGAAVRVWEPVTTWWQPSAAAADRAIGLS